MKLKSCLPVMLLAALLAGCAAEDAPAPEWAGGTSENTPAKLLPFNETAHLQVRWKFAATSSDVDVLQQPLLTPAAIYIASSKGSLVQLDRMTGKLLWRIDTKVSLSSGVGGATDLILLGGEKGDVLAYNVEGQLRWKSRVSSEVLGVPQLAGNVVIVRSGDGHVVGLNADDGRNVWSYERSLPALVVRSHAGVVVRNGVAYAGFAGGKLVALNVSDGTLLWEASVSQPKGSTELERISDIISDPVVDSEQACAVAFQGGVACFSPVQGNALWTRDVDSDKGLALLRKHLYFSDAKGVIYSLDKDTGSTLWRNDKFTLREGTVPLATEKFLVFGDLEGYLHALNREDGSMAARIQLESGAIQLSPIEMDGGLLVQARSGSIYSLSLQ